MVESGMVLAQCVGFGNRSYKINKFYIEFENVALPGDAVSVPSFLTTEGREYYAGLSTPRDYLRVDLDGDPTLQIASGYESYFTAGTDGNSLHFRAISAGTEGQNGVTFSDGVNSKVFGIALVAGPDDGDITQDLVVARRYYDVADQKLKQASGQIGVSWDLDFVPDS